MPDFERMMNEIIDTIINMDVSEMEHHLGDSITMDEYHDIKQDAISLKRFLLVKKMENPQFCN